MEEEDIELGSLDSETEWKPPVLSDEGKKEEVEVDLRADEDKKIVVAVEDPKLKINQGEKDNSGESDRVKKRIKRAERETNRWRREALQAKRQLSELTGTVQSLVKEVEGLKTSTPDKNDAEFERRKADLEKKIAQAQEDGKSDQVAKFTVELAEVVADQREARREAARRKETPVTKTDTPLENPTRDQWLDANAWFYRPGYERAKQAAIEIDQRLLARGSDKYSEDHYEAIERELKKRFPKLKVVNPFEMSDEFGSLDDDEVDEELEERQPKREARRASAPQIRGNRGSEVDENRRMIKTGRVKIDDAGRAAMKMVGLDPDNDEHLKKFAQHGRLWTAKQQEDRRRFSDD